MNPSTRSGLRIGPVDLKQVSTWRGIGGFIALFGIAVSPELTDAIGMALAAFLSAIEIYRDEYARRQLPPITLDREALVSLVALADRTVRTDQPDQPDQQLRQPVPAANDATEEFPPPPGFSNR